MATIALGNFDGVHIAHKAVLQAAARQGASICLLFKKHPLEVLTGSPPAKILSTRQAEQKILALGVEHVEYLDFAAIKDLSPEAFFRQILVDTYHAQCVCCGYNYTFGKGKTGTVQTLKALCEQAGVKLIAVPKTEYEGKPVSSSRIRGCIAAGQIEAANAMLGYPFFFESEVVKGKQLGRTLGFPTINQYPEQTVVKPLSGVYLSATELEGKRYKSITNIGCNPTVGGERFRSESYLFGFEGNAYGKTAKVELLRFIRAEQTFESIQALKAQVMKDIQNVE